MTELVDHVSIVLVRQHVQQQAFEQSLHHQYHGELVRAVLRLQNRREQVDAPISQVPTAANSLGAEHDTSEALEDKRELLEGNVDTTFNKGFQ